MGGRLDGQSWEINERKTMETGPTWAGNLKEAPPPTALARL